VVQLTVNTSIIDNPLHNQAHHVDTAREERWGERECKIDSTNNHATDVSSLLSLSQPTPPSP